jgi:transcriptional regulator with XRE-family HTH domain
MDNRLAAALGSAARGARGRAGLTQADVAERVGIAPEVYGRMERGRIFPSVETLRRLCLVLDVSSDVLLGLAGPGQLPGVSEPPPRYDAPPEVRRLMRRLRRLDERQLRLVGLLAAELGRRVSAPRRG